MAVFSGLFLPSLFMPFMIFVVFKNFVTSSIPESSITI